MSGTFPTTIKPTRFEITSFSPTLVSTSHSLKRQVRKRGGGVQRWAMKMEFPPMKRASFAEYEAFIINQAGQYETFEYTPPDDLVGALGTYSGSVSVNGDHTAGDTTIAVTGQSGTLNAGSWVSFANHTKVYKIVTNSTSSLNIFPALQENVDNTTVVTYDSPTFTVSLTMDNFDYIANKNLFYNFEVSLIEVY